MKHRFIQLVLLTIFCQTAFAQREVLVTLANSRDKAPIPFATINIPALKFATYSDETGNCNIPAGVHDSIFISSIGFNQRTLVKSPATTDTILLDPYVSELQAVTVGKRKYSGKIVLGMVKVKSDLRWGPSGRGEEFAQLIKLPEEEGAVFKIKTIMLRAEYFNPAKPVLLHIYSVNPKNGHPDKDLLQTKHLLSAKQFKSGRVVIDLQHEELFIDEKAVFVGFEWLARTATDVKSNGNHPLLYMTRSIPEFLTYTRYQPVTGLNWMPANFSMEKGEPKPLNTIFTMEVERYK